MPRIITISNQKGGVGKTTLTGNLAACYAETGKKVCVIDADYQGDLSSFLGIKTEAEAKGRSLAIAIEDDLPLEEVVIRSEYENLDVVAGTKDLEDIASKYFGRPNQWSLIKNLLDSDLAEEYDIILCDTRPDWSCLTQSCLAASHAYILPIFPEKKSIDGLSNQIVQVDELRQYQNKKLEFLGAVVTRFEKSNKTHEKIFEMLERLDGVNNFHIFKTLIIHSKAVAGSDLSKKPLIHYNKRLKIANIYSILAGEILPKINAVGKPGVRKGRPKTSINPEMFRKLEEDCRSVEVNSL